jgi:hypothetical protein
LRSSPAPRRANWRPPTTGTSGRAERRFSPYVGVGLVWLNEIDIDLEAAGHVAEQGLQTGHIRPSGICA